MKSLLASDPSPASSLTSPPHPHTALPGGFPLTVNLVGMLRAGPDPAEPRDLLCLIGVRTNTVLTADATREKLERLGRAALNIVLFEPSGKEAAIL